ncbi:MAG: protein kinase [Planctomycetales bacterium]|nr:protein kinase [Planctomycetales bacterium]
MSEETQIEDLLDAWEEARARGQDLDVSELCRESPHLEPEVARRLAALAAMDARLARTADADDNVDRTEVQFRSDLHQLAFHAKGGLGAVYVGQDQRLKRQVAVKFIHRNRAADGISRQLFELEAEITGRLDHPGVVPIYGTGTTTDGRTFYAMRFIDGQTLGEAIRCYHSEHRGLRGPTSVEFRNLLYRFVSACNTIGYAHNRGIVHRDIKPDNVMLGRYGETLVVDWGLACPVQRSAQHRSSGEHTLLPTQAASESSSAHGAGTPSYMSPEQAAEEPPTPASDIYSLGATLFKILTGHSPFRGESVLAIRQTLAAGAIPQVLEVAPDVPAPLAAICSRAMAARPADRYENALLLAQDVERYLADEPVSAYREPLLSHWGRWMRRYRSAAALAMGSLVCCLILAMLASAWLAHAAQRARAARADAEQARRVAEASRRENLGTSASFLAKSLAQEIELRWRTLESEAASPRGRALLEAINARELADEKLQRPDFADLQSWLEKRYIANGSATRNVCWCIYSQAGTQVARVPDAPSIGVNFRHRDYFHGEGRDLTPDEVAERSTILPLANHTAYVSAVFQGSNTKTLMVTFAVPIWDGPLEEPDRKRIGILAMPVELGAFGLGSHAILADTRQDQLRQRAGLILHHPQLGLRRVSDKLAYLNSHDLERGLRLRTDRRITEGIASFGRGYVTVFDDFVDPVRGVSRLSAMEPVIVSSRDHEVGDTGWLVIATEEE